MKARPTATERTSAGTPRPAGEAPSTSPSLHLAQVAPAATAGCTSRVRCVDGLRPPARTDSHLALDHGHPPADLRVAERARVPDRMLDGLAGLLEPRLRVRGEAVGHDGAGDPRRERLCDTVGGAAQRSGETFPWKGEEGTAHGELLDQRALLVQRAVRVGDTGPVDPGQRRRAGPRPARSRAGRPRRAPPRPGHDSGSAQEVPQDASRPYAVLVGDVEMSHGPYLAGADC